MNEHEKIKESVRIGDWDYEDLFDEECAQLPFEDQEGQPIDSMLMGDGDFDTPQLLEKLASFYSTVATPLRANPNARDQESRFVSSFQKPSSSLLVPLRNTSYKYTNYEDNTLKINYQIWMDRLKALGIVDPLDVAFVTRSDFVDVINQLVGNAMKGQTPTLTTTYQFHMRIPPSLMEKRINGIREKSTLLTSPEVRQLYESYLPMKEDTNKKILWYYGEKGPMPLTYTDYRTRERYIRKHILKHFISNKSVATQLCRSMKLYTDKTKYIRQLPIDVNDFRDCDSLIQIYNKYKSRNIQDIYLEYRANYLTLKCYSRLSDTRVNTYTQFSTSHRSTYYRYEKFIKSLGSEQYKLLIITRDKTASDVCFRKFFTSGKFKSITIQGDYNHMRMGSRSISTFSTDGNNKRYMANAVTSTAKVNYDDFDYIVIDTINLGLLRNSIVFGDYQESQEIFNHVVTNTSKPIIWRSGAINYFFTKSPVELKCYRIKSAHMFKAAGPEVILTIQPDQQRDNTEENEFYYRKILLYKLSVNNDIVKLQQGGIAYYTKPLKSDFIKDNVILDDAPAYYTLYSKKMQYVSYSKTRQTKRFQVREGADLVHTYLADKNLNQVLNMSALKSRLKNGKTQDLGLNITLFQSNRSKKILSALVMHNYNLQDAYLELNSGQEPYTMEEINLAFGQCVSLPSNQKDDLQVYAAIRKCVMNDITLSNFAKTFPILYNSPDTFEKFFEKDGEHVKFKGLIGVTYDDMNDPLIYTATQIENIEINGITEIIKEFVEEEEQESFDYEYNPVSPQACTSPYEDRYPTYLNKRKIEDYDSEDDQTFKKKQ